jgi:NAD(P)-dependent dehydrogenase (short-subunit alcohol dehydrogenase family)
LKADAFRLDQGSEEAILQLRDDVIGRYERVHILVNNAVARPMKDWTGAGAEFGASMAINATGLFLMTRAFGAHMAENSGGSIINVGSIQGMVGPDFSLYEGLTWSTPPDYFFHKGGLLQLTRFAASKLGPRGVRVNAVSPGGFLAGQEQAFAERYAARTFLGRMANDDDLGGAIVFLASDASSYITGANLVVDGGYTAK